MPRRRTLNNRRVIAPDLPEERHFYTCDICGQRVDMRQLGDVLHHEEAAHEPLLPEPPLGFVPPMLPTLVDEPPDGDTWLHEIKHDGYRTQLVIENGSVRAFTRNGHDWTGRYRNIVQAAAELRCANAIIDGEAIVQDEHGRSDFHHFKEALSRRPQTVVFMAFDLLHLDSADLRRRPLFERRRALEDLVGCHDPGCRLQYSEHVTGDGAALFQAADHMGLEGIVSKRLISRYRSGRSRDWLKVKCWAEAAFVVIAVERGSDGPPTALLAREKDGELIYAGSAAVTLRNPDRERFWRRIDELATDKPALPVSLKDARWVRPALRVRARHLKGSDKLRHATLRCLESDVELPH